MGMLVTYSLATVMNMQLQTGWESLSRIFIGERFNWRTLSFYFTALLIFSEVNCAMTDFFGLCERNIYN